mgnify:CR=1 FL=1
MYQIHPISCRNLPCSVNCHFYSQYKYTKKLDSGEYTLKLMLRSPSKKLLEKLKKTAMLLRHNIGSISIDVYTSQKDAITGSRCFIQIGHDNIQSCVLINFLYKAIILQYSWLSDELAVHHHWKFPINKKTILMLTCPIENVLLKHLLTTIQAIVTRFIFIDISFICCQVGEAPTTSPTAICIMQAVLTNAVWPSTLFWLILYTKCIHEHKFLLFLLLASC